MSKNFFYGKKSIIVVSVIIFLLISFVYSGLFRTFYQQDEWVGVGMFAANGALGTLYGESWVQFLIGAGRPLAIPLHALFYRIFPFQIWPFASFSILFHTLNTLLIYILIIELTGSIAGACAAAAFFAFSYNGSQAITWFAANTTTLPSAYFSLLSVLLFFKYVKKRNKSFLIWSQVCIIVSYYFKELAISLFLFIPLLYVLYNRQKFRITQFFTSLLPTFSFIIFVGSVKLYYLLAPAHQTGNFIGRSSGGILKIAENALFYPVISFSQIFLPIPIMNKINPALTGISVFSDTIFVSFSVLIILLLSIYCIFIKRFEGNLVIFILFTVMSFIPYAILMRGGSYLDSRYFYLGMAGGGMIIGIVISGILARLDKVKGNIRSLTVIVILLFLFFYSYKNIQFVQRDLVRSEMEAKERQTVLSQLSRVHIKLPKNPIFFVTGDNTGYYGLSYQKLPFQQGIGYTLMVWYYVSGQDSDTLSLIRKNFLWEVAEQGYSFDGGGFGYFRNKEALLSAFNQNPGLSENQIIALYYKSGDRILLDITSEIRDYIRTNRIKTL